MVGEVLREAIRASGRSAAEIGRETGIPQPTITRFLQGADMGVERAGKLCEYFGLVLVRREVEAKPKAKKKGRK